MTLSVAYVSSVLLSTMAYTSSVAYLLEVDLPTITSDRCMQIYFCRQMKMM